MLRPKHPARLPATAMTRKEARQVIAALSGVNRLIVQLIYGAGLRLIECLRLRVGDVDFEYRQIIVRGGKGQPDHVTILPHSLVAPLQEQIEHAAALHRQDMAAGYGAVYLPPAIEAEHPLYPRPQPSWPTHPQPSGGMKYKTGEEGNYSATG